jgi:hypothetical protein
MTSHSTHYDTCREGEGEAGGGGAGGRGAQHSEEKSFHSHSARVVLEQCDVAMGGGGGGDVLRGHFADERAASDSDARC